MNYRVELLEHLTEKFEALPGIGRRSALRMAFYILNLSKSEAFDFASAITEASQKIKRCDICGCFCAAELCDICQDQQRDSSIICVVQSMQDVLAFERINEFKGQYHVLHGLISPMDGIGPDDLSISSLLLRVKKNKASEVIMAAGPTVEGEATTMYVARLLKPLDVLVTRLAYGVPVGASLEYTDDVTLATALQGRCEV